MGAVGIAEVDRLRAADVVVLSDYLTAASKYVLAAPTLDPSQKKVGQILLSQGLGKALLHDLQKLLPDLHSVVVGERMVGGALRTVNADVSEIHPTDGLRFAVEIKPVNLAVGRAIWNRFGDIRTFAVNLHLKFPFAVVGAFSRYRLLSGRRRALRRRTNRRRMPNQRSAAPSRRENRQFP
jgi:hypothetical protein